MKQFVCFKDIDKNFYCFNWCYIFGVRGSWGAGPLSAVKVGLIGGLLAGFPVNFYLSAWATFERGIPGGWLLELLVGAVLATCVAGWLYRDA